MNPRRFGDHSKVLFLICVSAFYIFEHNTVRNLLHMVKYCKFPV